MDRLTPRRRGKLKIMLAISFFIGAFFNGVWVSAFPGLGLRATLQELEERQLPAAQPFPDYPGLPNHALYNKFDPVAQLVSVSGVNAWQAPGPGDIRGPCPGLNAAANHGYIPRNGIADLASLNTGLFNAFGLDHAAILLLGSTSIFFDGDPLSARVSIGGYSSKTATLGTQQDNLLGIESGLCDYGHLKSEGDASVTRGDFLAPTMNSNCLAYPEFLQELLDLANQTTGGPITAPVLAQHQDNRKKYSIANNPNFFAPVFASVVFTPAAHHLVFQMFANHSAEYPRGILTPDVLMKFYSFSSTSSGIFYQPGFDRIPENWYRRGKDDLWTLIDVIVAVAQQCAAYPGTCQVGGNVAGVNTFAGIDLGNISGGFMNAASLSNPQILSCFIAQNLQAEVPSNLMKVFSGALLQQVLAVVTPMLSTALAPLISYGGCTNLPPGKSMNEYGTNFPGAVIQYGAGPRSNSP